MSEIIISPRGARNSPKKFMSLRFYLAEIAYHPIKRPGAISRRRLALKLSLTAGIHFGERSRALSSIAEAYHVVTYSPDLYVPLRSSSARARVRRADALFVRDARRGYRARSFDGCTYAARSFLSRPRYVP